MPEKDDYRIYLEEKFDNVHSKLDLIHEQTKETNGTVKEHEERIVLLEKEDLVHYQNCPQIKRIDKIDESLMEYKMMKKYPKFSIAAMFIFGATLIMLTLNAFGVF